MEAMFSTSKTERLSWLVTPWMQPFEKEKLGDLLELAVKEFHSKTVSLLAPSIPPWRKPSSEVTEDVYYRLEIERLNLSGKLRNMITRASREVYL